MNLNFGNKKPNSPEIEGSREMPELEQLKAELQRENYKSRYRSVLRSTIYTLIVVAAVAVLVATIWMPVLQIYGTSMTPTLEESDIASAMKKILNGLESMGIVLRQ